MTTRTVLLLALVFSATIPIQSHAQTSGFVNVAASQCPGLHPDLYKPFPTGLNENYAGTGSAFDLTPPANKTTDLRGVTLQTYRQAFSGPTSVVTVKQYNNACLTGGRLIGVYDPYTENWAANHGWANYSLGIDNGSGTFTVENMVIKNSPQDSIAVKGAAPQGLSLSVRGVWISRNGDDWLQNDNCGSLGTLEDILVDSTRQGLSMRPGADSNASCGNFSWTLRNSLINHVCVKGTDGDGISSPQCPNGFKTGQPFKFSGSSISNPTLTMENVLIRMESLPTHNCDQLETQQPTHATYRNVVVVWDPADGHTPWPGCNLPNGWTVKQGTEGKTLWNTARTEWLQRHGCNESTFTCTFDGTPGTTVGSATTGTTIGTTGGTTGGGTVTGGGVTGTTGFIQGPLCEPRYDNTVLTPPGYGTSYNVFTTIRELILNTSCPTEDALFTEGSNDTTNPQYVYRTAYRWDGTHWVEITMHGVPVPGTNGAWLKAVASTTIAKGVFRPAGVFNFLAGYTCTFVNGAWKCGCRNSVCGLSFWQLQAFRSPLVLTPGPGCSVSADEWVPFTTITLQPTDSVTKLGVTPSDLALVIQQRTGDSISVATQQANQILARTNTLADLGINSPITITWSGVTLTVSYKNKFIQTATHNGVNGELVWQPLSFDSVPIVDQPGESGVAYFVETVTLHNFKYGNASEGFIVRSSLKGAPNTCGGGSVTSGTVTSGAVTTGTTGGGTTAAATTGGTTAGGPVGSWKMYDNITFTGQPDILKCGFSFMKFITNGMLGSTDTTVFDQSKMDSYASEVANTNPDLVVLNYENWRTGPGSSLSQNDADRMARVINTLRSAVRAKGNTHSKFSFYGAPFLTRAITSQTGPARTVVDAQDFLAPSLYISNASEESNNSLFATRANNMINAYRSFGPGKSIVPYIWPQFYGGDLHFLSQTFWDYQLQTLYSKADSVLVWGTLTCLHSGCARQPWNSSRGWWIASKNFASTKLGVNMSSCAD